MYHEILVIVQNLQGMRITEIIWTESSLIEEENEENIWKYYVQMKTLNNTEQII